MSCAKMVALTITGAISVEDLEQRSTGQPPERVEPPEAAPGAGAPDKADGAKIAKSDSRCWLWVSGRKRGVVSLPGESQHERA